MALFNFLYYYWAANIKNLIHWLDNSCQQVDWLVIKREDCSPFNIGAILLSPIKLKNTIYKKNPIIHSTLRIWRQVKFTLKLRNLSLLTPIANNPLFKPSIIDKMFIHWKRLGIKKVGDLYEMGNLLSLQKLQSKCSLKGHQYFRYLQIRDYLKTYTHEYQTLLPGILDKVINRNAVK